MFTKPHILCITLIECHNVLIEVANVRVGGICLGFGGGEDSWKGKEYI